MSRSGSLAAGPTTLFIDRSPVPSPTTLGLGRASVHTSHGLSRLWATFLSDDTVLNLPEPARPVALISTNRDVPLYDQDWEWA